MPMRQDIFKPMLDLTDLKPFAIGSYGTYYRLSKTLGIKTITYGTFRDVYKEMRYMARGFKCGIAPRPYMIVACKVYEGLECWGIVQEHIDAPTIEAARYQWFDKFWHNRSAIDNRLKRVGISYHDAHGENILWRNRHIVIVDWGPNAVIELNKTKGRPNGKKKIYSRGY